MNVRQDTRHLRERPPRRVGPLTQATVLFGEFIQQFGWAFFCIGSLLAWIFIPQSEAMFWLESDTEWMSVPGNVVSVHETNMSVNDRTVFANAHAFELEGQQFTGTSYTEGEHFEAGDAVQVVYDANNPAASYISGAARAVFPAWTLFILVFPLIGLFLIATSISRAWKAVRLLKIGAFTRGKLVTKEATNTEIEIQGTSYPVYEYKFEFEAGDRTHAANCKTHRCELVEDEAEEIILYKPRRPSVNVVFDAAPNMPGISDDGTLLPSPPEKLGYLLLPAVGLAIHLFFLSRL